MCVCVCVLVVCKGVCVLACVCLAQETLASPPRKRLKLSIRTPLHAIESSLTRVPCIHVCTGARTLGLTRRVPTVIPDGVDDITDLDSLLAQSDYVVNVLPR